MAYEMVNSCTLPIKLLNEARMLDSQFLDIIRNEQRPYAVPTCGWHVGQKCVDRPAAAMRWICVLHR